MSTFRVTRLVYNSGRYSRESTPCSNLTDALVEFTHQATFRGIPAEFCDIRRHPDYPAFMAYERNVVASGDLSKPEQLVALERVH